MCVLSTLCGNVDKHSPFDIYIYIYIILSYLMTGSMSPVAIGDANTVANVFVM